MKSQIIQISIFDDPYSNKERLTVSSSHLYWRPGYDISFSILSNVSNAGLSSLAKTKLWRRQKQEEKTGNKRSKQYFF